jgi:hypothetical protein
VGWRSKVGGTLEASRWGFHASRRHRLSPLSLAALAPLVAVSVAIHTRERQIATLTTGCVYRRETPRSPTAPIVQVPRSARRLFGADVNPRGREVRKRMHVEPLILESSLILPATVETLTQELHVARTEILGVRQALIQLPHASLEPEPSLSRFNRFRISRGRCASAASSAANARSATSRRVSVRLCQIRVTTGVRFRVTAGQDGKNAGGQIPSS